MKAWLGRVTSKTISCAVVEGFNTLLVTSVVAKWNLMSEYTLRE
jgi:hypothetical protein